jgi:hypothetical protein
MKHVTFGNIKHVPFGNMKHVTFVTVTFGNMKIGIGVQVVKFVDL